MLNKIGFPEVEYKKKFEPIKSPEGKLIEYQFIRNRILDVPRKCADTKKCHRLSRFALIVIGGHAPYMQVIADEPAKAKTVRKETARTIVDFLNEVNP